MTQKTDNRRTAEPKIPVRIRRLLICMGGGQASAL